MEIPEGDFAGKFIAKRYRNVWCVIEMCPSPEDKRNYCWEQDEYGEWLWKTADEAILAGVIKPPSLFEEAIELDQIHQAADLILKLEKK